jgi:hypothetical protein
VTERLKLLASNQNENGNEAIVESLTGEEEKGPHAPKKAPIPKATASAGNIPLMIGKSNTFVRMKDSETKKQQSSQSMHRCIIEDSVFAKKNICGGRLIQSRRNSIQVESNSWVARQLQPQRAGLLHRCWSCRENKQYPMIDCCRRQLSRSMWHAPPIAILFSLMRRPAKPPFRTTA